MPEQELKNAKRALIGGFALSLDSPQTLDQQSCNTEDLQSAGRLLGYVSAAGRGDHARQTCSASRRSTTTPSRLQIVAVGDSASVKKVLEKYGTVETAVPAAAGAP